MKWLKKARESCGYGLDVLANDVGVTRKTYISWEKGRSCPRSDDLIKLAKKLDVTIDYLCTGENADDCHLCHFLTHLDDITPQEAQEIVEIFDLLAWKSRADLTSRLDKLRSVAWEIRREKDGQRDVDAMERAGRGGKGSRVKRA